MPQPEPLHPIPVHALDNAIRRLNAELFARDCVAELEQHRRNWLAVTTAPHVSREVRELAEASVASIDRLIMPRVTPKAANE